jgi:hypothetical protein
MQAAGLYTPEAPAWSTEDELVAQAQRMSSLGQDDLQTLIGELGKRREAAQVGEADARSAFMGAQQAPMPQLQVPNMSPLVAMGSLAAGNMASVLAGRPEWAQAGPQKLNAMQNESLRSAQQAREENLKLLLDDYEKAQAAAKSAGDLEASVKFGEKIRRIHDIQDKASEGMKERTKAIYNASENAEKEKANNARALLQARTQLKIQEMQESGANWRAKLAANTRIAKGEGTSAWQETIQKVMADAQADVGGKGDPNPIIRQRIMTVGFKDSGLSFSEAIDWIKRSPFFELKNQQQSQQAWAMVAMAFPDEWNTMEAANAAEQAKTALQNAKDQAKTNASNAEIRRKLLIAPYGLSRGR